MTEHNVLIVGYLHDQPHLKGTTLWLSYERGMKGIYQHCGKQHLHRYAAEFDFRYNHRAAHGVDDLARADLALRRVIGTRLTYAQ